MSYKTILVHVDQSRHAEARIKAAARLAIAYEAHLIGTALIGISRFAYLDSGIDLANAILAAEVDALEERAQAALARFEAIAAGEGVLSVERRLVNDAPAGGLALEARYADLVVLGQAERGDPSARDVADVPGYVMLNGARPVLVMPASGAVAAIGDTPLVAWDASAEATRAVTNALPLLKRARKVTLAVLNPQDAGLRDPGADIALYLARHGVRCEVVSQPTAIGVGDALLSMAADLQSDLLVMGGYGHTRFRELLLGGVTETVLRTMTVPVLMSH